MRRIVTLCVMLLSGCAMKPLNYINDAVVVKYDEQTGMQPATVQPKQQIVFSRIGQRYRIRVGEPVEIVYSQIDVVNTVLVASSEEGSEYVTLTLQERTEPVVLTSKCQTFELRGIDQIPSIIATNNENIKQQVVVTPILSSDCSQLVGYEIRYGSIQQGCTKTSYLVERLSKCRGMRSTSFSLNSEQVKSLKKLWFNIDR